MPDVIARWLCDLVREAGRDGPWGRPAIRRGPPVPPGTGGRLLEDLSDAALRPPQLRAFVAGGDVPIPAGTAAPRLWRADPTALAGLLSGGATLAAVLFHERSRLLGRWVDAISEEVGWPATGSVVLGGAGSGDVGLPLHWDDADVVALQIAGRKHWRVANTSTLRSTTLGYEHDRMAPDFFATGGYDESSARRWVLEPGDAVVLPRGTWHAAVNGPEGSLHVAILLRTPLRGEAMLTSVRTDRRPFDRRVQR